MQHTIAFYNIENLFDTFNDPFTNDDDFLPTSNKKWNRKKYEKKIYKVGSVIPQIGDGKHDLHPAIVGLAEVENSLVLGDLINSDALKAINYGFIHFNSLDERGIDVALLYDKDIFKPHDSRTFNVFIQDETGNIDFTRDILLVSGTLNGEMLHLLVNHWPSRREGQDETAYKRMAAANKVVEIVNNLRAEDPHAKVIIMGDFNDNPDDESIRHLVKTVGLYNPMETLRSYNKGSVTHRFTWNVFDQIMITPNFFETEEGTLKFENGAIFDAHFLTQYNGKYKGHPYRTFVGSKHKNGYSDHFPVYVTLKQ